METSPSEADWIHQIEGLIEEGQCFLAYDRSGQARGDYPDSRRLRLLAILALMRSGGVLEARKILGAMPDALEALEPIASQILDALRQHLPPLLTAAPDPQGEPLDWLLAVATQLKQLGERTPDGTREDLGTLDLCARIHAELWRHQGSPQDLRKSRHAHLRAFQAHRQASSGVHAARLSWLLGETELARTLARQVLAGAKDSREDLGPKDRFFSLANQAECALLTDDPALAEDQFRQALRDERVHYAWVLEVRNRLLALQEGDFPVPASLLELMRPPVILIGGGHPLDLPGAAPAIFPPACEDAVKHAIQEHLDRLGAHIGYSSASAGTELLFVEAMLERDAEVHLVLPFATEDFIRERVAPAGARWERRFRHALKLVASVTHATEERYLGHDWLFRFNNQIIDGLARLRADLVGTAPHLLLVWDYAADQGAGTAADFMDHWPDIGRLRLIDLDAVRSRTLAATPALVPAPAAGPASPSGLRREPQRVLKTLLFADLVGFSKLREEELPGLWSYLAKVQQRLADISSPPDLVESWGDALYVVMSSARALLRHAFALQDSFIRLDPRLQGLPEHLSLRIGLHAGPVYTGQHPLTGRPIVYGSHVSRTARIEPITLPGNVYASQQFVALLTAEEGAHCAEQASRGRPCSPWYACEYLGYQQLAKNYGNTPVYHLLP
ncbi:MAG: adenylate/guanylate cyclase domain-containing protein [Chromatiaceae bacterium]|nr:adenylate/guanylate cyclase domain-containing protein [Chromatiaceae bacterium]